MCVFCEGKERIEKQPELFEEERIGISLGVDKDEGLYKLRLEVGSINYTLPIRGRCCMFCGKEINKK